MSEIKLTNATLIFEGERGIVFKQVVCSAKKIEGTVIGALPGETVWRDTSASKNLWATQDPATILPGRS